MHDAITNHDFSDMNGKRVLVKGCSDKEIPENAYVELVEKIHLSSRCPFVHINRHTKT